jgi:hypothetical protein
MGARNSSPLPHRTLGMSRFRLLLSLAAVVALGLLSRLRPIGWSVYDKSLGDILYAVAAYLVLHRWRPSRVAPPAVESFQATGIPARYAAGFCKQRSPGMTSAATL